LTARATRAHLRSAARAILRRALAAADPGRLVRRNLRLRRGVVEVAGLRHRPGRGRVVVLAAGKAAVPMARAAEAALGTRLWGGIAVSTAQEGTLRRVRLLAAGHPVPDERGLAAAREVEALAAGLAREDLLLVLLSGGASALLPAPAAGITLQDKALTTRLLMRAGATIHELNAVRKHLSRLKGGGLARAAHPARVATLVLSDVVGDELSTVASGPTVPDPTTFAEALGALERRQVADSVPEAVRRRLQAGARGAIEETPKPRDRVFRGTAVSIVGSNRLSVDAASREARRLGLRPLVLTTRLEGEAREAARVLAAILRECVESARPECAPVCLLAGGETTVTVRGDGQGGRNQEMAVAAAEPLAAFPVPAVAAFLATDGIDGASDAAGGVVDDRTAARAAKAGLAPASAFLAASDSRNYLGPIGDLIVTGPTGTNVVDLAVLLAGPRRKGKAIILSKLGGGHP
jgi:hydroxypyruvate reductase